MDTTESRPSAATRGPGGAILGFPLEGEPTELVRFAGGHINETYLVTTSADRRYVLQRLNARVFPEAELIMGNVAAVTRYLDSRPAAWPRLIRYMPCLDGDCFYSDGAGGIWRLYRYVEDCVCLARAERPEDVFECARAFGGFAEALADFPAEELMETLEGFHDTPRRLRRLEAALASAGGSLPEALRAEADFALSETARASVLQRMRESGELPLRVTHNDTKLSNVLLDADSRRARCIIDLDTVMPGLTAWDFGDLVRSGAARPSPGGEGGLALDLEYYRFALRGYLEACPGLSDAEKRALPLGVFTMALECGVRYLTDHLEGGGYFAADGAGRDLERARSQLGLARDVLEKLGEMERILRQEDKKTVM